MDPNDALSAVHVTIGENLAGWIIEQKLGEGGFGAVYLVRNHTGQYAMKMESTSSMLKVLKAEYYVLTELKRSKAQHFCEILDSGLVRDIKYLVMTLVGMSLTDLRKHDPTQKIQKLTMGCSLSVGIKALDAIRELHSVGYLHRDIKPGNFAIGRTDLRRIFLLDFGMCRRYKLKQEIRPPRRSAGFRGTLRYAPLSCHISREQCRKDDLESWIYQQVELSVGKLPWKKMDDKDDVGRCKQLCRRPDYIKELFGGCPREFVKILNYIDSLRYYDEPDYSKIENLMKDAICNSGAKEYPYDWETWMVVS